MLKKIKIDTLSISDVNKKIKERDFIYDTIKEILNFNIEKNIKLKHFKAGNIRLISDDPNIAQEILLRKTEIIDILQKNYPEKIKDLKIRVEKI